jgi:Protein of unknown function (DUF974)
MNAVLFALSPLRDPLWRPTPLLVPLQSMNSLFTPERRRRPARRCRHSAMSAPPPPPPQDVNPISLKVMRLCKPSFHFSLPVPFPPVAPAGGDPEPGVALSPMLALPQSFGDIFLGETFSCYISLCNIAPIELAQVGLKVEVQTQLARETLSDSSVAGSAIARFASQQTLDKIIEYDLKDIGIHILICSALYTDSQGERKYFRKVRVRRAARTALYAPAMRSMPLLAPPAPRRGPRGGPRR